MLILKLGILLGILSALFYVDASVQNYFTSEVLVIPLSRDHFGFTSSSIDFHPSLLNYPDLPSWLQYTFSKTSQTGYIYGAPPPNKKSVNLEVIAMDTQTYNLSRRIFNIDLLQARSPKFSIEFKISNLNIDEFLVGGRLQILLDVITHSLWQSSVVDGKRISLLPASMKGDRLPLNPNASEGVYVSYGSDEEFSHELHELEMEVKPLWNHRPCPKYFKKTSYERFFRLKGFAVDWCSFKLNEKASTTMQEVVDPPPYTYLRSLNSEPLKLIKKSEVVTRSYILDIINTLLIPLLVMLVLLALLTLAMCCHRNDMDLQSSMFFDEIFDDFPRMPTMHDIQMVHYPSVTQPAVVGRLKRFTKDSSPHPSLVTTTTQIDTLPRSQTVSPVSTLNGTTSLRRFEDYQTLTRPAPPPYKRQNDIII